MLRYIFSIVPLQMRVRYLKHRGIPLGTRYKENRKIYLYMVGSFFVEVLYEKDLASNLAEEATIVPGLTLTNLNAYLEREFRKRREIE